MKAQVGLEFLSTYGFLFLMLALVLVILAFYVFFPKSAIPAECSAYGGPTCQFSNIFTNASGRYSLVTLVFTNSEGVPINLTNVSVTVRSAVAKGFCTPGYLYPGQESTCAVLFNQSLGVGSVVQAFYALTAKVCNSGIANIGSNNCGFENVTYSGYFSTSPDTDDVAVFSVAAMQSPPGTSWSPLAASPASPSISDLAQLGFTLMQNGDWVASQATGSVGYAFATKPSAYIGVNTLGFTVTTFPSTVSVLNDSNVACSGRANSTLSIAYTTLYSSTAATPAISVNSVGSMAVYYKAPTSGLWTAAFGSGTWISGPAHSTLSIGRGYTNVAVVWADTCGSGMQALNISGVPFP